LATQSKTITTHKTKPTTPKGAGSRCNQNLGGRTADVTRRKKVSDINYSDGSDYLRTRTKGSGGAADKKDESREGTPQKKPPPNKKKQKKKNKTNRPTTTFASSRWTRGGEKGNETKDLERHQNPPRGGGKRRPGSKLGRKPTGQWGTKQGEYITQSNISRGAFEKINTMQHGSWHQPKNITQPAYRPPTWDGGREGQRKKTRGT